MKLAYSFLALDILRFYISEGGYNLRRNNMTQELNQARTEPWATVPAHEINDLDQMFHVMLATKKAKARADAIAKIANDKMKTLAKRAGEIKLATKGVVDHTENANRKQMYNTETAVDLADYLEAMVDQGEISNEDAETAFNCAMDEQGRASDALIQDQVADMEGA